MAYRRRLDSQMVQHFRQRSVDSFSYGKHLATHVSTLTLVMKTIKGRDKLCAFVQYIAQFYYHCNKYSEIPQVLFEFQQHLSKKVRIAYRMRLVMKNTRKIFKFLKFIDQISSVLNNFQSSKPFYLKVVNILQNFMACVSNLFDNLIWAVNVKLMESIDRRGRLQLKSHKYLFSLLTIIFKMLGNNFKYHNRIRCMNELLADLKQVMNHPITDNSPTRQLCKKYLRHREEIRIEQVDMAIMVLRILMLTRKLKLPGHSIVTNILYSGCGVVSTCLSLYKMVIDQPLLVQLRQRQKHAYDFKEDEAMFETIDSVRRVRIGRTGSLQFR